MFIIPSGCVDIVGSILAVFITTLYFPQSAYDFIRSIGLTIVLIDGIILAELMLDRNIVLARYRMYEIKKIDSDYIDE